MTTLWAQDRKEIQRLKDKLRSSEQARQAAEERARQADLLAESAENDCQRAIDAKLKAELDLRCLQESTVDIKAFDQMKGAEERAVDLGLKLTAEENKYGEALEAKEQAEAKLREAEQERDTANAIMGQIEARFPDWQGYRDLVDCIDVTLHRLREDR